MMMSARCVVVVASTLLLPLLVALLGRLASAYPRAPLLHFAGRGGLVRRQAAQRRDRQQPGSTGSFDGGYTAPRKKGLVDKVLNVLNPRDPGALILVRHGQTTMNSNRSFTGETASPLLCIGRRQRGRTRYPPCRPLPTPDPPPRTRLDRLRYLVDRSTRARTCGAPLDGKRVPV